jgi:hypothetical protein
VIFAVFKEEISEENGLEKWETHPSSKGKKFFALIVNNVKTQCFNLPKILFLLESRGPEISLGFKQK